MKSALLTAEVNGQILQSGDKYFRKVYNGDSDRVQAWGDHVCYSFAGGSGEVVDQPATARLHAYAGVVCDAGDPSDQSYAIPINTWGWICIAGDVHGNVDTTDAVIVAGEPLNPVNSGSSMVAGGTRASGTVTIGTFGSVDDKILTVGGVPLTEGIDFDAEELTATGTITILDYTNLALKTVTITVGGTPTVLTEGTEWVDTTSNEATATSLATEIDGITGVDATATGAVVTVTASAAGAAGNAIAMATNGVAAAITLSGATLAGGEDGDNQTAANLAAAINTLANVYAVAVAEVVTIYAAASGTGGNAITLATDEAAHMSVSAATLENGAAIGEPARRYGASAIDSVTVKGSATSILMKVRAFE